MVSDLQYDPVCTYHGESVYAVGEVNSGFYINENSTANS
jgi:hypothetical protein